MLAVTEAKLPSDGFSLVDPLEANNLPRDLLLEVAGFRYYTRALPQLTLNDESVIATEPNNVHDANAVQFLHRGRKIGNINRLQAASFQSWLRDGTLSGVIERLNGSVDRPRAFVFIKLGNLGLIASTAP